MKYVSITLPIFMFFAFEDNIHEEFISLKNINISINKHDLLMYQKIKNNLKLYQIYFS